ncbi:Alpha/Beta hydrolase protein [Desarmillaria tabescens]|uniref:Alpha/Beta hydrolase protein n=1 Tax=Armillaria tabescens TaxID=1929756 RepID=A0AA39NJI2_ARMTA|nr:Alpha/Beta hydrolase protein [Desarmillaria tabescens]KAK0466794.1 Alpha/Beta hydrolase protein [Desarmillaria tabescens]
MFFLRLCSFLFVSQLLGLSSKTPTFYVRAAAVTALTADQITAYKPYTFFAGAAYCQPSTTLHWDCGSLCAGNSDFIPITSGGDGNDVQFWYVGYSPSLSTVIVAHQGTVVTKIESLLTDADFLPTNLDPNLFPGLSSHIEVHSGFKETQKKSAEDILQAVTTALSDHSSNSVTLVGHSLGGALSLLDAVYLPLQLTNATFRMIGYGMPRVGNQEFADYVDSALGGNLTRINNKQDFIPTLPPRLLGFHHPSGEIHINNNNWNSCPGQENPSDECTDGAVETIFSGDVSDHAGPYDGIMIRC